MKLYPLGKFPLAPSATPIPLENYDNVAQLIFDRTIRIESLQKELTKIMLYPKKKRDRWINQNQSFLEEVLEVMKHDTHNVVERILQTSPESQPAIDYMMLVQQTLITLERIVTEKKSLGDIK